MDHRIPNETRYKIEEFIRDRGITDEIYQAALMCYGLDLAIRLLPDIGDTSTKLQVERERVADLLRWNEQLRQELAMTRARMDSDAEQEVTGQ